MPAFDTIEGHKPLTSLPFPPVTKAHILNCSYESWYPKYRRATLRSRIIPLTPAFLDYLREDGLWLPDDEPYEETPWSAQNSDKIEDPAWESDTKPSSAAPFQEVHETIQDTIKELGGSVVPKLNWSAPKDALHMALSKNSSACRSASEIYLLLKSSIFVTHDLENVFDDCIDLPSAPTTLSPSDIPYVLVLRPHFQINTSFEFRCFVKNRMLICLCQRDLKYIAYPSSLLQGMQRTIQAFFDQTLKNSFPDSNFVFDVYLPEPHDRVRLIDINPWAPRTDPLLFSWLEMLDFKVPGPFLGIHEPIQADYVSIQVSDDDTEEGAEDVPFKPDFRVIQKDDPEAYNFGSAPYSAHKLPREVVDAGQAGGGAMKELLEQWEALLRGDRVGEDEGDDDDDDDE